MTPTLAEILKPTVRRARLVWLAHLVAIPCYVVVAWFLWRGAAPREAWTLLTTGCVALSIALAATVIALPRIYPSDGQLRRLLAADLTSAAQGILGSNDEGAREAIARLSTDEAGILRLCGVFRVQALMRGALAEAIALLGFVLAFASANPSIVLPFAVVSLALQIAAMPRFEPLAERAREFVSG